MIKYLYDSTMRNWLPENSLSLRASVTKILTVVILSFTLTIPCVKFEKYLFYSSYPLYLEGDTYFL